MSCESYVPPLRNALSQEHVEMYAMDQMMTTTVRVVLGFTLWLIARAFVHLFLKLLEVE